MTPPYYAVFTGKTSIPVSTEYIGQVTTSGTIVTITQGQANLKGGDYIYDENQNEVRKIISFNESNPILEEAFTSDITVAIPLFIVDKRKFTSISITNIGTASGSLSNNTLKKRTIVNYTNDSGLEPITIDGTGTQIAISGL